MLDHNEAQLDFILEMYATEHPKELKITRPDTEGAVVQSEVDAKWANVLTGRAHQKFMAEHLPPEAILLKLRARVAPAPVVRVHPSVGEKSGTITFPAAAPVNQPGLGQPNAALNIPGAGRTTGSR